MSALTTLFIAICLVMFCAIVHLENRLRQARALLQKASDNFSGTTKWMDEIRDFLGDK